MAVYALFRKEGLGSLFFLLLAISQKIQGQKHNYKHNCVFHLENLYLFTQAKEVKKHNYFFKDPPPFWHRMKACGSRA
jgi:hypothetical protein